MRRLTFLSGVALILAAPPVAAAETASLEGTVVLGATERPAAGAEVTLIGARVDGSGRFYEETVTTDDRGRYSFDNVRVVPEAEYALEATYDDGLFVFDTMRLKTGTTETAELRVFETTTDPSVITVTRDYVFLVQDQEDVSAFESVTVVNESGRAYIGRGKALGNESSEATLGFALPDEALGSRVNLIDSTINRLYAEPTDFGFAATVAIPPGETDVTFAYPATGSGGSYDVSRRALYPIEEFSVFATRPLEVTGDRLSPQGTEEISGVRYRVWASTEGFDAGDLIPVLAVAEGSSASNLWLGLGIGLGVVIIAAILAMAFRSRRRPAPRKAQPEPQRAPEELVSAIAEIDLKHESGALSDKQWEAKRTELKDQLIAARQREPAK